MRCPSANSVLLYLAVAAGGLWLISEFVSIHVYTLPADLHLLPGQVAVSLEHPGQPLARARPFIEVTRAWRLSEWGFRGYSTPERTWRTLPLWLPTLAFAAALGTRLIWRTARADARSRVGRCPGCAYNLAGLPLHAPCPECGQLLA